MQGIVTGFLPQFFSGLLVNVEIALLSMLAGALAALPLLALQLAGGLAAAFAGTVVAALRAAPTFVVMFFLLNALPRDAQLFGVQVSDWGMVAVVLSQGVYAAAYLVDNGLVAWRALRAGDMPNALLFLPNCMRAFCVILMSSGVAAAVGIPEAIFITIREAERMPDLGHRVLLFLCVMLFFAAVMQIAFAAINRLRRMLAARAVPGG
jgi:ABC-type amino acid transport system permease subunit